MHTANLTAITPTVEDCNKKYVATYSGSFAPAEDMVYLKTTTPVGRVQFLAFHTATEAQNFQENPNNATLVSTCTKHEVVEVVGADFELLVGGNGDCFVCSRPMEPATLAVKTSF